MSKGRVALVLAISVALSACASKAPKQLPPDPGAASADNANNGAPVPQQPFAARIQSVNAKQ